MIKTLKIPTPTQSLRKRFSKYFVKTDNCWEWIGHTGKDGYGRIWFNYQRYRAPRISFLLNKYDPGKMLVLHECDNPKCVNPDHLFLGMSKENVKDMCNKKRQKNQLKTSCPSGHKYEGNNLYISPEGHRQCRECKNIRAREKRKDVENRIIQSRRRRSTERSSSSI